MEFRILGPLQVLRDGVPLVLGGTLQRSVLARLLLDAGRVVRAETLIDDVWAGRPPPTAGKTLQKYISGLRKIIGRSTLRTVAGGYAVDVAGDLLDSRRFEKHVEAGARENHGVTQATSGASMPRGCWRGGSVGVSRDVPRSACEARQGRRSPRRRRRRSPCRSCRVAGGR